MKEFTQFGILSGKMYTLWHLRNKDFKVIVHITVYPSIYLYLYMCIYIYTYIDR